MTGSTSERYLRLGLQIDRHVDGTVDAYFGPAELRDEVQAADPVEPAALLAEATALLGALEDGWLRDQVSGLRVYAGVLAGETWTFADEAEGSYGVRPAMTDEAVFAAAHDELDELLPGRNAGRAPRALAPVGERPGRADRADRAGGDRGGPGCDPRSGRAAGG